MQTECTFFSWISVSSSRYVWYMYIDELEESSLCILENAGDWPNSIFCISRESKLLIPSDSYKMVNGEVIEVEQYLA
jgi:hypothetical protein